MKIFFFTIIYTLLAITVANAQVNINGKVVGKNKKNILGANITLGNTYDGASTDSNGNFTFTTFEKGIMIIKISNNGYKDNYVTVNLDSTIAFINVVLKEKINELMAIKVSAGAFEASDEKKGTVLKSLDIVTTAGSNGDLNGALKTLPGTQQNNDKEGLFVRGGTGYETQTFIDGTLVRNAFLSGVPDLGARGRFNPFLFKGTTFSAGGYSALYGQALSSAVILETDDMPDKSQGFANLSSVGGNIGILKVNKAKTQSASISYSNTNLAPYFYLVKQNVSYSKAPVFHQIDISYRKKIGKRGLLKMYSYGNLANLDINRKDIDSYNATNDSYKFRNRFKLHNDNIYSNISYKDNLTKKLKINIGACYSNNTDNIFTQSTNLDGSANSDSLYQFKTNEIASNNQIATMKIVLQQNFGSLNNIRFGAEQISYLDNNNLKTTGVSFAIKDNYTALFTEGDVYITNDIAGKIGVRSEYSSLLQRWNIAPRVSIAYKLSSRSQLSAAYGDFYQKPENRFLYANANMNFMKATHYILNYLYQTKDYLLRLEAFNKQYNQLPKNDFGANTFVPQNATNDGYGYARGVELFWRDKKTLPGLDYWISYSYIDTKRNWNSYLRNTQPDFVASQIANLVIKKFWVKKMFGINGTYTFSSGRPYLNFNKTNPYVTNNNPALFLSDYAKPFHNVSLSCNYLKTYKKVFNIFVISVTNVLQSYQEFGYNYSVIAKDANGSFHKEAIRPAATSFIFLGWFMSWGVDKSEDVINNNL